MHILSPNIRIPARRSNLVLRPRLVERLNAGIRRGCTLTIISAPAGYGKTTILSEWAAQCDRAVAWLSLDDEDNTQINFLSSLAGSLQRVFPSIGLANVELLESLQSPPIHTVLDTLVNDIFNGFSDIRTAETLNPVFIVDDYHVVESPSIHNAICFLIERLAPVVHVMIASRNQPPLPLARLRVRGSIADLDANDLRFTPAEARAFFCGTAGLHLSNQASNALQTRTEGWVASMQIAALSLQERQDPDSFVKTFTGSHHIVHDYLVDEVVKRQSPEIQDFMLRTSVLDRLSGPLCDAVSLEPSSSGRGGQEILEFLERNNLFLVPLDDDRRWFRYHQLFAELLRYLLERGDPDKIRQLTLRAAAWCEHNGMVAEAIKYLSRVGAMDQVARLVEEHSSDMLTNGRIATLSHWMEMVPEEFMHSHPRLALVWCLTDLHHGMPLGTVTQNLKCAIQAIAQLSPAESTPQLRGMVDTVSGIVARRQGDNAAALRLSQLALSQLDQQDRNWRAVALVTMGTAATSLAKLEDARCYLTEAYSLSQSTRCVTPGLVSAAALARVNVELGQLRMASEICQSTLETVEDHGDGQPLSASELYWVLGDVHREWNDLESASCYLQRAISLGRQFNSTRTLVRSYLLLAQITQAQNDYQGASSLLRKAQRLSNEYLAAEFEPDVSAYQARLWLKQNKLDLALCWAQGRRTSEHTPDYCAHSAESLIQAHLLIAQRKTSEAIQLLQEMEARSRASQRHRCALSALVLLSLAHQSAGNEGEALAAIGEALAFGEPEGFIRLFADEGPAMEELLTAYLNDNRSNLRSLDSANVGYIKKIIAAAADGRDKSILEDQKPDCGRYVDLLTRREVRVLNLVASGLSNSDIATDLTIALCTVKTHLVNIFGKLQVANRTQAVARARELQLLDA